MGLVGLAGGGIPPHGSTELSTGNGNSTVPPVPFGTRAFDSSGGEYIYLRGSGSTAQKQGCMVLLDSSNGFGGNTVLPTAAGITSTAGAALAATVGGSAASTVGVSTSQYFWGQVYGPGTALAGSTTVGGGSRLYLSTAVLGAVTDSSGSNPGGPAALSGLAATSSNASSIVNVFFNYPHVASS